MTLVKSAIYDQYIRLGYSDRWSKKKAEIKDIEYNIVVNEDLLSQLTKPGRNYNRIYEEVEALQRDIDILQNRREELIKELKEIEEEENK